MNGSILIPERFKLNGKTINVIIDNEYCQEEKLLGEADFTLNIITLCDTYNNKKVNKRSKEQKLETDKSTRKISIQANAMEKARLKDEAALVAQLKRAEKQALKSQKAADKVKKAQEKADAKKAADDAVRLYKPKVFVAREAKAPN